MRPVLTYEEAFVRDLASAIRDRRTALAPRPPSAAMQRMYAAAKPSRLYTGLGSSGQNSADTELVSSLRNLRAASHEMVRDAGYAKRAKTIVVSNVVGSGIGLQAQVKTTREELNQRVNTDIEEGFEAWSQAENCHTGGQLHFSGIEQMAMGQTFESGEIFIREHYSAFGRSQVPYALEIIEPERVIDEFQPSPVDPRAKVRLGCEMDAFHRPIAWWIRTLHPGEVRMSAWEVDKIERVPADQIIHLRIIDRWPQTRGVPWMHTAIRKLYDTDGYSEAEIVRARAQANTIGGLKTDRQYGEDLKDDQGNVVGRQVTSEAGTYEVLYADEELQFPPASSPNPSADPFLRFLLREVAAGIGVSYESLSRDYSQSNYSSSRLALLDDRDLWRIYQIWFIRSFRMRVHRNWLRQAVLSRSIASIPVEAYALDPAKYEKVRYKPRGWSWVDPTKEVEAYKEAIKAGLTTRTDVIAQTANGRDIEDMDEEREQELKAQKEKGLVFDTDPELIKAEIESKKQPPAPKDNGEDLKKISDKQEAADKENGDRFRALERVIHRNHADQMRAFAEKQMVLNLGDTIVNNQQPQVNVDARSTTNVPEQPVTVNAPVTVNTPETTVNTPVTVNTPETTVNAPVTVNTPETTVNAPVTVNTPETTVNAPVTVNTPETTVNAPVTVNTPETTVNTPVTVNTPETTVNAPVTVNTPEQKTEIKNEVTVPEREMHFHQEKKGGKRTIKLKDRDGKIVRTAELEE